METKTKITTEVCYETTCFHPEFLKSMSELTHNEILVMMTMSFIMDDKFNTVWFPKEAKDIVSGHIKISVNNITRAINGLIKKGFALKVNKDVFMLNPHITVQNYEYDPSEAYKRYDELKAKQ